MSLRVVADDDLGRRLAQLVSHETEQAVIGGLLARNGLLDEIDAILSPQMFGDALHGRIYAAIRELVRGGQVANFLTLRQRFEGDRALVGAGGARYLAKLENAVVTLVGAGDYAAILRDLWQRRQIVIAAHEAESLAIDGAAAVGDALGRLDRLRGELAPDAGFGQSMADILAKPKPSLRFLVPDFIPMETVTLLSGHGAVGKSYVAMQLMAAMATGTEWLGMPVEPGPSLGLFCEDPEKIIHLRQANICERLGLTRDLRDMHVIDRAGQESELFAPREGGNPNEAELTALWHRLVAKIHRVRPKLILLDTAADVFGGNEIVRRQVRRFIMALVGVALDMEAAVLLNAHPSVEGLRSGSGLSGSTGWYNSVRSQIYMTKPADDADSGESDPDLRVLKPKKANLGPLARELRIRWDDGAYVREHDGAGDLGALGARLSRKKLEALLIALVAKGMPNGEPWSLHKRSGHRWIVSGFIRIHHEFTSVAVRRSLEDLLARDILREAPRTDTHGRGLIVNPAHKPDKPDDGPAGGDGES